MSVYIYYIHVSKYYQENSSLKSFVKMEKHTFLTLSGNIGIILLL